MRQKSYWRSYDKINTALHETEWYRVDLAIFKVDCQRLYSMTQLDNLIKFDCLKKIAWDYDYIWTLEMFQSQLFWDSLNYTYIDVLATCSIKINNIMSPSSHHGLHGHNFKSLGLWAYRTYTDIPIFGRFVLVDVARAWVHCNRFVAMIPARWSTPARQFAESCS